VRRRLPAGVIALAAVGAAFVLLPVAGLLERASWGRFGDLLTSEISVEGLRVSLIVSAGAAFISLLIGVPLGLLLGRTSFPGITVVRALAILPLVLPPVVAGIGLLTAFGRRGLLGGPARAIGLELPFTTTGAVVAAAFVSFPFVVLAVEGGLRSLDTRLEDAAASLGGSSWYVLRRITLPLLGPQIVAGAVLAWARALGEFGATITFAGNFRGETQTMPLAVFEALQSDPGAATVLSLVLVATSLAVLIALRGRFLGATA
jgi:molybdate transport system permease protein